jgi:hypothetical protein
MLAFEFGQVEFRMVKDLVVPEIFVVTECSVASLRRTLDGFLVA